MAPLGTVIKNGIIFAIFSIPLLYVAAVQFAHGLADILTGVSNGSGGFIDYRTIEGTTGEEFYALGILEMAIGLAISIVGVGIVYMKTLSDTVEDGMIEF